MELSHLSVLGHDLYIDTHIVDATDDRAVALRRLSTEGWLRIMRSDVMDTELMGAQPDEKRRDLLEASSGFVEAHGPAVVGHSRLDASVLASQEDVERLNAVYAILFPGVDRATARRNHLRDAMHVATAIRYGGYAFVTRELKLLNKDRLIAASFAGFRVWNVDDALRDAAGGIRAVRRLHELEPGRGEPPSWPHDDLANSWLTAA